MHSDRVMTLKRNIRNILGERLYYRLIYPLLLASPKYYSSMGKIRKYKNIHQGKRCFIIGNGSSLRMMDLSPLASEYTFGMNRIYLLFDTLKFTTSYYVVVNKLVIQQCGEEIISRVPVPKFISYDARHWINYIQDVMFLFCREGPRFYRDITHGVWQGATVTFIAMQIAYYMGFQKVILIGVDHSYVEKGRPNETVVSQGEDQNHFDPGYFGKGFRWQLPDLATSEIAYSLAKEQYKKDNREIVDATLGGRLEIFPKVDYRSLFR